MTKITINGVSIPSCESVSVLNGRVIVDGVDVTPDAHLVNIVVTGNLESLSADHCQSLTVNGVVFGDVTSVSGDITCGDVTGSVSSTAGDIKCGSVGGSVKAKAGDVYRR